MKIKFDNLEELMMKFPIDNKHNFKYHYYNLKIEDLRLEELDGLQC